MDTHKNAPLTPKGREAMVCSVVEGGLSHAAAARQFNTTPKTVAKWVKCFPHGRCGWFAGSVLTAPFIARPNPISHMCHCRERPCRSRDADERNEIASSHGTPPRPIDHYITPWLSGIGSNERRRNGFCLGSNVSCGSK